MIGGPLADQFGHRTWIGDLIRRCASKVVSGHVADGVARCLDRMHAHFGQGIQHIRHIAQLWPVVLDVLACGEVAVTLIPLVCDERELTHLATVQGAIRNCNAQHVGVQLQIQTVHQAQRLELILGQRSVDATLDLIAKLGVAGCDEGFVEIIIGVHLMRPLVCRGRNWMGLSREMLRENA